MNLMPIQQAQQIVLAQEQAFNAVLTDEKVNFAKEAQFACQYLANNQYLAQMAVSNQQSLVDAVTNVAAIGITLNPAAKHAYLVPRDKRVCLDISYMGLLHIAIDSGAIQWGQCKIVHKRDTYENNGIDSEPTHKYAAFGDRGDWIGAYCVVKTATGDYLTHEMTRQQIEAIANRSPSYKKGNGPWKTDFFEMVKKTVVKQAYKYWPKCDRLNHAIDYQNNNGEGVEISHDSGRDINLTASQMKSINDMCAVMGRSVDQLLVVMPTLIQREISTLDELTKTEAEKVISFLDQKIKRQ